ncbi:MAG: DUF1330 domain-containing protein [Pseudomonadota bacterium]|nr:DUF1330 domain-containing protein [Pseudomonadota bacterium]
MPALQPTTEQMGAFAKDGDQKTPIFMINLLKFHDHAQYKESDAEYGEEISGEAAYSRYGKGLEALAKDPSIGLSIVFAGKVNRFLIGGDEDWDRVLVVKYPTRQHMLTMMRDPRYQEAHRHREAGLKHQDLIETYDLANAG